MLLVKKRLRALAVSSLALVMFLSFGSAFAAEVDKGWQKTDGNWYFYDNDGTVHTDWLLDGGFWYYLDDSGVMLTGWQKVDDDWYYLNASGDMATGWQKVGGKWYYLNQSGAMQTGWVKDGKLWYYLNPSGAMQTGWQKIDDVWYYLNPSGAMAVGWKQVNNTWYHLNSSGAMTTGWKSLGGKWYYFNQNGAMQTGWLNDDGKWYYLNEAGDMSSHGAYDIVDEAGIFEASPEKKQAAQEAARIAIDNWDKEYGWTWNGELASKPVIKDISTLRVGEAIPAYTLLDGKLIYRDTDYYPVICDNKLIATIRLQRFDVSDRTGCRVAPTESISNAGYLGGPYIEFFDAEPDLNLLREGCAFVTDRFAGSSYLINSKDIQLVYLDSRVTGVSIQAHEKAMFEKTPKKMLLSKPLSI